jgi:tryptophan-rich sensory protein
MPLKIHTREIVGLVLSLLLCYGAATLGARATTPGLGSWYDSLRKPSWTPPDRVFGPVWSALYTMMAVTAWDVWRRVGFRGAGGRLGRFGLQLALNVAWPCQFFPAEESGPRVRRDPPSLVGDPSHDFRLLADQSRRGALDGSLLGLGELRCGSQPGDLVAQPARGVLRRFALRSNHPGTPCFAPFAYQRRKSCIRGSRGAHFLRVDASGAAQPSATPRGGDPR